MENTPRVCADALPTIVINFQNDAKAKKCEHVCKKSDLDTNSRQTKKRQQLRLVLLLHHAGEGDFF